VRCCRGPFFDEWEFHTLFGLTRGELALIARLWPKNAGDSSTDLGISNSLTNLLGYPRHDVAAVEAMTGLSRIELEALLDRVQRAGAP
jgi:hypothetical protein